MKLLTVIAASLMLAACATSKVTEEARYSGFLDDYSQLVEHKMENGGVGLIWVDPDIAERGYTKALLEPVVIYPAPKRESPEAQAFIKEVKTYMDAAIQSVVGQKMIITSNPGPDTVRVRFALTGVEISNEDLASYEYIPVALIFAGAKMATGKRAQAIEVFFEAEMLDSVNGEVLGRSVRKGFGKSTKNASTDPTKEDMYPQLDLWAEDAGNIANIVKGQ